MPIFQKNSSKAGNMNETATTPLKKTISFKDFIILEPHDPDIDPEGLLTYKTRKRRMNHGIDEETEPIEEALTIQQRMRRKLVFKRNSAKLRLGRERASHRHASRDVLVKRAIISAKNAITTKLLGGRAKSDVSFGERARVEKILVKRKKSIIRIAMKMLPAIRKKDQLKFSSKPDTGVHALPKDATQHSETAG